MATRMPRMTMTTRSSMSVKPLSSRARRALMVLTIRSLLPQGGRERGRGLYRRGSTPAHSLQWGIRTAMESPHGGGCPKTRRARSPAPSGGTGVAVSLRQAVADGLRAGGRAGGVHLGDGRDGRGRGALGDLGRVAADVVGAVTGRLVVVEAVGSARAKDLDADLRGDAGGLLREVRGREAGVAAVAAGRVLVPALGCRDRGADVRHRGGVLGVAAGAQIGRDGNRNQDAEDDDDDQELDERETALLTSQARL